MSKKKRIRKLTSYCCLEGDRESTFLVYLVELYKPAENNISFYPENSSGGCPDKIVKKALDNSHRDKSLAWFDEDFEPEQPLSAELRKRLAKCWNVPDELLPHLLSCPLRDLQDRFNSAKRKPILVVSSPVCCESIILKVLETNVPIGLYEKDKRKAQIKTLKDRLQQLFGEKSDLEYYRQHLTVAKLDKLRKEIEHLDYLISLITK